MIHIVRVFKNFDQNSRDPLPAVLLRQTTWRLGPRSRTPSSLLFMPSARNVRRETVPVEPERTAWHLSQSPVGASGRGAKLERRWTSTPNPLR